MSPIKKCGGVKRSCLRNKDKMAEVKGDFADISIEEEMDNEQFYNENEEDVPMYSQVLSLMSRLYIGSISFEVRESDLRDAFEVFGPVKAINMGHDHLTGASAFANHKGFAFIEYEIPEPTVIAEEAMNGMKMGGRMLKVSRPANTPETQAIIDEIMTVAAKFHRVYIASVHPHVDEPMLESVFEVFGNITKLHLTPANYGGHRGFGYIEYSKRVDSVNVITQMDGFIIGGQTIRVGKCITSPDALNYLTQQTSPEQHGNTYHITNRKAFKEPISRKADTKKSISRPGNYSIEKDDWRALSVMCQVYVESISVGVSESELKETFEKFGPVKKIEMIYDESTGNHKGIAFINFEIPEAAVMALNAMDGVMLGGQSLKVRRPPNMPDVHRSIENIMIEAAKYNRMYIAFVLPVISEADMKCVFEEFGEVTKCKLPLTQCGRNRGFGYIEFRTREELHKAIEHIINLREQCLRVMKCITPPEVLMFLL